MKYESGKADENENEYGNVDEFSIILYTLFADLFQCRQKTAERSFLYFLHERFFYMIEIKLVVL